MDELGTAAEVAAVRSILQRGVAVVATAHGIRPQGLMANPELNVLLGGLKQVTISDALARSATCSAWPTIFVNYLRIRPTRVIYIMNGCTYYCDGLVS